jgi:hypothetical protein
LGREAGVGRGVYHEAFAEKFKDLYAALLIEIRKEAYPGTEMQKELLANLPFNMSPR